MLKKLLASALAVATVASCAYVPSALASAATTTKVADATEYSIWELTHQATPEAKVNVTVYVAGSVTGLANSYTINDVKVSENNEETIKAKLAEATGIKTQDANALNLKEIVSVSQTANASIYVAQINEKKAVYYSEFAEDAATNSVPASTKADDVKAANVTLLGWYDVNTTAAAIVADMYATGVTPKIASWAGNEKEFAYWDYTSGNVIAPKFRARTNVAGAYTSVDVYYPDTTVTADRVINGSYALIPGTPVHDVVSVPNNDKANWLTYVSNFAKANWTGTKLTIAGKTYTFAGVRQVADKKYAAVFTKDADPTALKTVNYSLSYQIGTRTVAVNAAPVAKSDANYVYTTNADEVYAIVKATDGKATLAEYLDDAAGDNAKYVWDGTYTVVNTDKSAAVWSVDITINVVEYTKCTVYSYDENSNVVKNDKVYIAAAKLTDLDANNNFKKVTAADLGVVVNARVEGVPAVYTSAKFETGSATVINTTYTLGDETAVMTDFATATGAFDSEAYFCRAAKAGDQVTLKVSLSETGAAKQLDLTKLEVAYSVVGATVVKTNYDYVATEYPAGEAIDIALAEGTNIVTATIKYNGKVLGTTEPFYAYDG